MKKLVAITVSVNYSDFLIYTLEENYKLFDTWYIVTDTKDEATVDLCSLYPNVEVIQTDVFYENGASFNKYAGINVALSKIPQEEDVWTLFLDSDIALHYETRRVLRELNLDPTKLYGIDRLNISGLTEWLRYKSGPGVLKENWLLHADGFPLGARLVHYYGHEGENGKFEGWRPLGFFQLAHRSAFTTYPQNTLAADHEDLVFARQWPRDKREFIPELLAIHLESPRAHKAVNWWGRKSVPFDWQPNTTTTTTTTTTQDARLEDMTVGEVWWEDFDRMMRGAEKEIELEFRNQPSLLAKIVKWLRSLIMKIVNFIRSLFHGSSTTTTTTTLNHYYGN